MGEQNKRVEVAASTQAFFVVLMTTVIYSGIIPLLNLIDNPELTFA